MHCLILHLRNFDVFARVKILSQKNTRVFRSEYFCNSAYKVVVQLHLGIECLLIKQKTAELFLRWSNFQAPVLLLLGGSEVILPRFLYLV